ncbi:MAG: hypothetical protein U1F71_02230 [Verrucomicrobiaceae bacterium]
MIPLPDWSRLNPPKLPSSGGGGPRGLGEGLLALGAFPMIIFGAIAGGSIAAKLHPWLGIPGGLVGLALMTGLLGDLGLLCGVVETIFYSLVTFVFSGGLEKGADPTSAWIKAGVTAVIFIAATYSVWKKRRA